MRLNVGTLVQGLNDCVTYVKRLQFTYKSAPQLPKIEGVGGSATGKLIFSSVNQVKLIHEH